MVNLIEQLVKFCGVGLIMLVFSTTMFFVCFEILDLPLYITYVGLYIIAIYISYALNATFTFKSKRSKQDLSKYYFVYLVGMALGLAILYLLSEITDFSKFQITLVQIVPRTAFTFILTKLFIYKE